MRRVTRIIICFLVLALFQTSIGIGADGALQNIGNSTGKTINVRLDSVPSMLDPQLAVAEAEQHVINNIFEGLMREVNGKIENGVASSYSISQDGTVYTFKIRDAKWSDGKAVTAQDFEYAWKRGLDPNTGAEYAFLLYHIEGAEEYNQGEGSAKNVAVKAIDAKTLQVTLTQPTPYFLKLTTSPIYMPMRADIVTKNQEGWGTQPNAFVSNGPFQISKTSMETIALTKNSNYYKSDSVKLDGINFMVINDDMEALNAYREGKVDILNILPVDETWELKTGDKSFKYLTSTGTYYYMINAKKAPFNDLNVRKALSLAIDRKYMLQNHVPGYKAATGLVPPGLNLEGGQEFRTAAGNYGIDPNGANIEEAKQLLAKAGYPNGKVFPEIELLYNTNDGNKIMAEAVQQMWQNNLGIKVKLKDLEWPTYVETRHEKKFDIARGGWLGDIADPIAYLEGWTSYGVQNETNWENDQFDQLASDSYYTTGKERDDILLELEKMIMNEMVVIPLYYYTDSALVRENVQNWYVTNLGYWYFGNTNIQ
ncbi:oligopeptide transport system substrate-binding protein [Anaerosolibacter carboniphilus]|uniref:Oligopeptide transport system substrate-binding protein n=1 Tax=Anaerosolibacter carboniphilus TaxID=1417629 RepID=A0A841L5C4_9FIRM|nr:peptide ABC transporter substrate-binding protein [Anaerosolibacter carboniphilus]MBB6217515.1 oligopeptide transport system substrate-binding protein [Anaerosolibacter carboniphilus]